MPAGPGVDVLTFVGALSGGFTLIVYYFSLGVMAIHHTSSHKRIVYSQAEFNDHDP